MARPTSTLPSRQQDRRLQGCYGVGKRNATMIEPATRKGRSRQSGSQLDEPIQIIGALRTNSPGTFASGVMQASEAVVAQRGAHGQSGRPTTLVSTPKRPKTDGRSAAELSFARRWQTRPATCACASALTRPRLRHGFTAVPAHDSTASGPRPSSPASTRPG